MRSSTPTATSTSCHCPTVATGSATSPTWSAAAGTISSSISSAPRPRPNIRCIRPRLRDSAGPWWEGPQTTSSRGSRSAAGASPGVRESGLLFRHCGEFEDGVPIACRAPGAQRPVDEGSGELRLSLAVGIVGVAFPAPGLERFPPRNLLLKILHGRRRDLVLEAQQDQSTRIRFCFLGIGIGLDDGVPLFGRADAEFELPTQELFHPLFQPRLDLSGGVGALDDQIPAVQQRAGVLETELLA